MPDFKILEHFVNRMETTGVTCEMISFSIDQELANEINEKHKSTYSLDELQKAANKCLAHNWIQRVAYGGSPYSDLRITPKGIGVVISKVKSDKQKSSRSWLKKSSDFIEDHKGLFTVLELFF